MLGTDVHELFVAGSAPGDVSPRRPDRDDEGKGAAATRGRNPQKGEGAGIQREHDRARLRPPIVLS